MVSYQRLTNLVTVLVYVAGVEAFLTVLNGQKMATSSRIKIHYSRYITVLSRIF